MINLQELDQAIANPNHLQLDNLARTLERLGGGSTFRRISNSDQLKWWCQTTWVVLRKRLNRANKKEHWVIKNHITT